VHYFGAERPVSVSRELSKLHEETIRGTAEEVLKHFEVKLPKGEIVVVVGGKNLEARSKKQDKSEVRKNC
jgi:16S rRNA (cytidine1402-2'-O)-methyltransferase